MENKAKCKITPAFFLGVIIWVAAGLVWGPRGTAAPDPDMPVEEPAPVDAYLYFAAPDGVHLKAVPKQFASGLDAHGLGKAVLEALMAGPSVPGVRPTFPGTTRVNALFITGDKDAYVDLGMDNDPPPPSDTITEYIQVYSLVNTLTVNTPQIRRVKILVNGSETASFGGHISLDAFFKTNMLIVK